jgi:hypothetical protein
METEPNTGILMPPDIERLEGKLDFVLAQISGLGTDVAVLKSHQTDIAQANIEQHGVIMDRIDTLCEQGRVRNGRLEKGESRIHKLELWRSWVVGIAVAVGVVAKVMFDVFTK